MIARTAEDGCGVVDPQEASRTVLGQQVRWWFDVN
jgi:hypothetical protein